MRQLRARSKVLIGLSLAALAVFAFLLWVWFGGGRDAPRIGLSVSDDWYDDLGFHRVAYDVAVARAGGRVVTLKPSRHAGREEEIVESLDGILLAGGGDIEAPLYGGSPQADGNWVDPERDRFELELLKAAEKRGIPVVGICRGTQLMAVAYGGDVHDLRETPELHERHGITLNSMSAHDVKVLPGTRLSQILAEGSYRVNSFHAQAVGSPGRLRVCARSPDGVIEGLELPGDRLVLGIQWHPEILGVLDETQQRIIEELIEEARKNRLNE